MLDILIRGNSKEKLDPSVLRLLLRVPFVTLLSSTNQHTESSLRLPSTIYVYIATPMILLQCRFRV